MEIDLRIDADGTRQVVTPTNGEYYTKEELQGYYNARGTIVLADASRGDEVDWKILHKFFL